MNLLAFKFGLLEADVNANGKAILADGVTQFFRCGGAFTTEELAAMTSEELTLVANARTVVLKEERAAMIKDVILALMAKP